MKLDRPKRDGDRCPRRRWLEAACRRVRWRHQQGAPPASDPGCDKTHKKVSLKTLWEPKRPADRSCADMTVEMAADLDA